MFLFFAAAMYDHSVCEFWSVTNVNITEPNELRTSWLGLQTRGVDRGRTSNLTYVQIENLYSPQMVEMTNVNNKQK